MKNLKIGSMLLLLAVLFMMPTMADAQNRNNDDAYSNQYQRKYNQQNRGYGGQKNNRGQHGRYRNGNMQHNNRYTAPRPPMPPMYSRRMPRRMMMHNHYAHNRFARRHFTCRR